MISSPGGPAKALAYSFYISRYWLLGVVRLCEWSRMCSMVLDLTEPRNHPIQSHIPEIKLAMSSESEPESCHACWYWLHGYMFTGPCLLGMSKGKRKAGGVFLCVLVIWGPCMMWICRAHSKTLMMPFSHIFTWSTRSRSCLTLVGGFG